MIGNTNRDLLLNLEAALAQVIDGGAIKGYKHQLDNAGVERTREELQAQEYLDETLDLEKIDKMLCTLLEKDHTAVV